MSGTHDCWTVGNFSFYEKGKNENVRFEVSWSLAMKNTVFDEVTPYSITEIRSLHAE
jgi:hypothetical protein